MGKWRYSATILDLGTIFEVTGFLYALVALPPGKVTTVPIELESGWPPTVSLDVVEKKKPFHTGNRTPNVQADIFTLCDIPNALLAHSF
jgi:hypothetical protein